MDVVEVYCPLDICRQRNIIRGDRYETQSEEQYDLMAKNIKYNLKVDTSTYSSVECADIIIKELFEKYAELTDDVEIKLDEADKAAAIDKTRYTHDEVFSRLMERINDGEKI